MTNTTGRLAGKVAIITGASRGIGAATPLARIGSMEEMAEAILWLSSDAAAFVTGVTMPVDGGRSMS